MLQKKGKRSIKYKIIINVVFVLVLALTCTGILLYARMSKYSEKQKLDEEKRMISQMMQNLNYLFNDIELIYFYVSNNERIIRALNSNSIPQTYESYANSSRIYDELKKYRFFREDIFDITLVNNNEDIYSLGVHSDKFREYVKENWYTDFLQSNRKVMYSDVHEMEVNYMGMSVDERKVDAISYMKNIMDVNNPAVQVVIVVISIRMDAFERMFLSFNDLNNQYILLDGENEVISHGADLLGEYSMEVGKLEDDPTSAV
ncbi:MAG: hypothetical protein MJA31_00485, partial [Clostridia bacterium]|nr:hypothetical protein [Clostridia bacterium]